MKAKPQTEIPFQVAVPDSGDLRDRGVRAWRDRVLPMVRAAIERLTLKECAVLFDSSPSGISDALSERERKRPALEWLVVLLVAAPEATRLELLTELCRVAGYKAPERARELTAEEELRLWKRAVQRLAPGIAPQIEREVDES